MTLELQLSSDIEAQLRKRAAATGQGLADFVLQAVAEKLAAETESLQSLPVLDDRAWQEKLQAFIDLHPVTTRVVDDSRESIYSGRGE